MSRRALTLAIALASVGALAGCSSDDESNTGSSDTWTVLDTSSSDTAEMDEQDTGEDEDPPPPPPDFDGTSDADDQKDTYDPPDTTPVDTGVDTGVDTSYGFDTRFYDTSRDTHVRRDVLPKKFGSGSHVDEMYIDKKSPNPNPRCCFDIDGNGGNDNAFADFLAGFPMIQLGQVNSRLNNSIQSGDLIMVFEYKKWSKNKWKNDMSIDMFSHEGKKVSAQKYETKTRNYTPNGTPRSKFMSASTNSAKLTAKQGTVVIPMAIGMGIRFNLHLKREKLTAKVPSSSTVGMGGKVELKNGKLGGAVPKKDLYDGMNRALGPCRCLQGKLIQDVSGTGDNYQCNPRARQCVGQCGNFFLLQGCSRVTQGIGSAADIDTNSNGTPDALSFGASFHAKGVEIVGVSGGP